MKKRIIAVALSMIMAFSAISQPYTSYATDQETEMLSTSTEDAVEESSTVASSESTEESSTAASSESAEEPSPSASPEASEEPSPSASPEASEEPGPSASPEASEEPGSCASPETSEEPSPSASPEASEEPSPSASPEASEEPSPSASPSASPEASEEPSLSASPEVSEEPSPSASPEVSEEPSPSASPEASEEPSPSASSEATEVPSPIPSATPVDEENTILVEQGEVKAATATVYEKKNDSYVKIEKHSDADRLNVVGYKNKTVYVETSDQVQTVYFTYKILSLLEAKYSVAPANEYTSIETINKADGNLVLKENIPAGTSFTVTAVTGLGEYSVKVVVIDKISEEDQAQTGVTVTVDNKTFKGKDNIVLTVGEPTAQREEAILHNFGYEESEFTQLYMFDIEAAKETTITVGGLVEDNHHKNVMVLHLLDSKEAIEATHPAELSYFETSDMQFAKELAAAKAYDGKGNGVYYTVLLADISENGDVSFVADSYSTFMFVVNFEYNGMHLSLEGGQDQNVEDLLADLGVEYTQEQITDITFTNADVLSADKENGEWMIHSLKGFDTQEAMYITFEDGTTIEIIVTDPAFYYYLTDTASEELNAPNGVWNLGTQTESFTLNGVTKEYVTNTQCVLPLTHGNNSAEANYTPEIDVFVHPGMALKVTRWVQGFSTEAKNADGWTFLWTGNGANQNLSDPEKDNQWFNMMFIDANITEYKKIELNLSSYYQVKDTYQPIKLRVHVIPKKDQPKLLKDVLEENPELGLEIKEYPVTLYNFDANKFNAYVNQLGGKYNFRGYSKGVQHTSLYPNFLPNKGASNGALQGIMKPELNADGYPEMVYDPSGVDVFSPTEFSGKEVYDKIPFEFVYDPETRRYFYSSTLNHAQYVEDEDGENGKVILYDKSLGATQLAAPYSNSDAGANTRGGFYPFEDIHRAFVNPDPDPLRVQEDKQESFNKYLNKPESDTNLEKWKELLKDPLADHRAQLVLDMPASNRKESTIDMQYGYSIDAHFYLPKDKMLEGEDMEFTFTGDDDLWVFIDGKLVLDIGGPHTPVEGNINLKTGYVSVNKAEMIEGTSQDDLKAVDSPYTVAGGVLDEHVLNLEPDQMHSLQVFYLERVGGVANCYLTFNLPLIPANSVTITNDIVDDDGRDLSIELMDPHEYQLLISVNGGEFEPGVNQRYFLNGDQNLVRYTDEHGYFYLKHGESAVFPDIPRFESNAHEGDDPTRVKAIETLDSDLMYSKVVTTGTAGEHTYNLPQNDGKTHVTTVEEEVPASGNLLITMTNYIISDPMTIECDVVGGRDGLVDPNQEFTYMLSFEPQVLVHPDLNDPDYGIQNPDVDEEIGDDHHWMTFNLKHGEKLILESVPRGMDFRLRAVDPDQRTFTSFDDPLVVYTYTNLENIVQDSIDKILTFIGAGGDHNEDSSLYMQQTLLPGNHYLKITNLQRGSLLITHNGSEGIDPGQSFIYHVKGTNEHNKDVDLYVAIEGNNINNPAAVKDVIIGDYTVTEIDNWSWRYKPAETVKSVQNTEFKRRAGAYVKQVDFTDTREEIYWLDGNSFIQNLFTGFSSQQDNTSSN